MYFCAACKLYVKETSVSDHDQSTAHLLASTRTPSLRKVWLPESNRGYQMMMNMGWKEDTGLGPREQGRVEPIATILKNDRAGLGMPTASAKHARVTHFPAHDDQRVAHDGLSQAQRMQDALSKKRKEAPSVHNMMAAQRKQRRVQEAQRDRDIAMELYSDGLEGYEQYLR
ncbi:hypothetical protein Poli38472_009772 [Pythium oligandrum]|uniref:G-patch domain-containing protein n=1 Tax=Pythium oligandrum TaxID=41045 RepID=A0A8K1FIN8_PYTOL|nr:hypothetical protein Poli38472_009772 [Pythium oligandrum]|eukprot:TMW62279.1 hypothetical protein Poli38472_009772 [Pythium oligandrum]